MSTSKDDRRSFLTKFSLGIFSLLGLPWFGKANARQTDSPTPAPGPILGLQPMGFSWEI